MSENNTQGLVLDNDGTVSIVMPPNDQGEREEIRVDILELMALSADAEREYSVPGDAGKTMVNTSPEFYQAVAKSYRTVMPVCTPTMAYQIWGQIGKVWGELQKKMSLPPT